MKGDGGPAFPVEVWETEHGDQVYAASGRRHCGMSLRDWFAGQALAGLCSPGGVEAARSWREMAQERGWSVAQVMAETAYQLADAMLEERDRASDDKA